MGHKLKNGKAKLIGFLSPVLAVTGLGFSSLVMAENCAEMPVSGKVYNLVNMGSGKYMDVQSASKVNGANIYQWAGSGRTNQQFTVTDLKNGFWSIRPVHSNKAVDLYGWSTAEGGTIKQWEYLGNQAQQWRLAKSSAGGIKVSSAFSGKLISVADNNYGSDILQKTDGNSRYQIWHFNAVDGSCGTPSDTTSSTSSNGSASKLIGFASVPGGGLLTTTGGGNATPKKVENCDQLAAALGSEGEAVIQLPNSTLDCRTQGNVKAREEQVCAFACGFRDPNPNKLIYWREGGTNTCESLSKASGHAFKGRVNKYRHERIMHVKSNKTLEGLGPKSGVLGVSFALNGVSNVIIRNLAIGVVNPDLIEAYDAISVDNSHHVWLDHLETSMISDGHVDIRTSKNVTVSWNRFMGENSNVCGGKHSYTSLAQDSQVTYHHNYWRHTAGRNPAVTGANAQVHVFNNFWKDVSSYSIGAYGKGQVKVEGNYFENSAKPHWNFEYGTYGFGRIAADLSSNVYAGSSGTDSYKDHGGFMTWNIPYVYDRGDATQARQAIIAGAGPR